MMDASDRVNQIAEYVAEHGYASLDDLATRFGISVSTARRDLEEMQRRGVLKRTRGGAVPVAGNREQEHPLEFGLRLGKFTHQKRAIGQAIAGMVQDGDVVILDGGTTTLDVARFLKGRPIQIVTNSMPIAGLLGTDVDTELIFVGGTIMPRTGVALGPYAVDMLRSLNARTAVMGIAGITDAGLFNANLLMVEVQQLMMKSAERVVIAADHSKFGRRSLAKLCDLETIDCVVSDDELDPKWQDMLEKAGVELILAS